LSTWHVQKRQTNKSATHYIMQLIKLASRIRSKHSLHGRSH